MAVNLATKHAGKIDQQFSSSSYTEKYVNKNYDFDGVATVNVYTLTSQVPVAYNRTATGDRYGGNAEMQDVVTPYTLTKDMAFKIAIDKGNELQSATARNAGEALKVQIREQITPMIDKDRLAAAATTTQSTTATATTGYTSVLASAAFLDEAKSPIDGRVLAVTPGFYNQIKGEIVTTMNADGYNSKLVGKGFVGELDGIPVVKIPTSYFPTKTVGLMWHRDALLGVKQLTEARVKTDNELLSGSLLLGRYIFGSFVLKGKEKAVAKIVVA